MSKHGAHRSLRLPKVTDDGLAAGIGLAFLATAGLFYVNIMPAIVDGLIQGLGFSPRDAGYVGSANVYGAALGALLVVFLVRRLPWRPAATVLLGLLLCIDGLSLFANSPALLIGARFVHGVAGGALVGIAFSVIARTASPDRTFGILLVVQFGLGGLGNLYLPRLVPVFGTNALFLALIAFSLATLLLLPLIPAYPQPARHGTPDEAPVRIAAAPLTCTLLAIFLFQASNMGLFAFIIGLARQAGLELPFITWTLAVSGWIGIGGALLVVALGTRFGRSVPLSVALVATMAGFWLLHYSASATLFMLANCATGITWAFVMSYLLGLAAEFDRTGQTAALAGFASKVGLASGPLLAGRLLGNDEDYGLLISASLVILVAATVVGAWPALRQDRLARLRA